VLSVGEDTGPESSADWRPANNVRCSSRSTNRRRGVLCALRSARFRRSLAMSSTSPINFNSPLEIESFDGDLQRGSPRYLPKNPPLGFTHPRFLQPNAALRRSLRSGKKHKARVDYLVRRVIWPPRQPLQPASPSHPKKLRNSFSKRQKFGPVFRPNCNRYLGTAARQSLLPILRFPASTRANTLLAVSPNHEMLVFPIPSPTTTYKTCTPSTLQKTLGKC
jgi:hypothetical protein